MRRRDTTDIDFRRFLFSLRTVNDGSGVLLADLSGLHLALRIDFTNDPPASGPAQYASEVSSSVSPDPPGQGMGR